ncbi:unnamed protein product [Moneuplotes crassus]|uniref:Macro domain-containing protein n=1 Tax=Euplotes crassus TaxID=5936 RepID=A0AAD2D6X2_EUPCR|nr:unnamed protein product [Moneuplotes crassus]
MDLKKELEKDFSNPQDLAKAMKNICERNGWRIEDMKNMNLTEDDIPRSLTRHIIWEKKQKKAIKEYQKCLESYQEFLGNFTLNGFKSDELKDALYEAKKRKEELKHEVDGIKKKYPTEFRKLDEEEELKIFSDVLENADCSVRKLKETADGGLNEMIEDIHGRYEHNDREADFQLKKAETELKRIALNLKEQLLENIDQRKEETKEIIKNVKSELDLTVCNSMEEELETLKEPENFKQIMQKHGFIAERRAKEKRSFSYKNVQLQKLSEILKDLIDCNFNAKKDLALQKRIQAFMIDLKMKNMTMKKNPEIIRCPSCNSKIKKDLPDDSAKVLELLAKPIMARVEFEEVKEKYESNVKDAVEKFHHRIKKKNAEIIKNKILPRFKKVSENLNEMLQKLEDDKERQKGLIKENNELRILISITQNNLETYASCSDDIKKFSEQETKYSQALKQVGDYEQDIKHLRDKKEYLERLIKEKSRPLRKKKAEKAEATDVYTFMYRSTRITVRKNDLVQEYVDAIVNPANEDLIHAGGAPRAIASKAGPEFERECEDYILENYKLKTGSSMVTSAGGELKCDYVIHTAGPIYEKNRKNHAREFEQLKKCFESILTIMIDRDFYDISIPAISTGLFGFPIKKCVEICAKTIKSKIDNNQGEFEGKEIILCNIDGKTTDVFEKWIEKYMEQESDDEDSVEERKDNYEDEESIETAQNNEEDYSSERDGALDDNRVEAPGDNVDSDY